MTINQARQMLQLAPRVDATNPGIGCLRYGAFGGAKYNIDVHNTGASVNIYLYAKDRQSSAAASSCNRRRH